MLAFSKPIKINWLCKCYDGLATSSKRIDDKLCQVFRSHWPSAMQLFAVEWRSTRILQVFRNKINPFASDARNRRHACGLPIRPRQIIVNHGCAKNFRFAMALHGAGNFSGHAGGAGGGAEIHPAGNLYLYGREI